MTRHTRAERLAHAYEELHLLADISPTTLQEEHDIAARSDLLHRRIANLRRMMADEHIGECNFAPLDPAPHRRNFVPLAVRSRFFPALAFLLLFAGAVAALADYFDVLFPLPFFH